MDAPIFNENLHIEPEHLDVAEELSRKIIEQARKSNTEEDLKMSVQPLINTALDHFGVEQDPKYEKAIYGAKRADVLYSNVVVEYKKPKTLKYKGVQKRAIEEIDNYFKGIKQQSPNSRPIGIILDGFNIMFVRPRIEKEDYMQKTFDGTIILKSKLNIMGPHPINNRTISKMMIYFRQLTKKILTAENLANDFGSDKSVLSRSIIQSLYYAIINNKSNKTDTLYNEWDRIFGIVYGESLDVIDDKKREFTELYRIPYHQVDLKKLLFSVHTFFAMIMKMIAAELVVT